MYILVLLYPSDHHIHRYVPHPLKRISYQGCWKILIGCRTDGDWKADGGLFLKFLGTQKGYLWRFLKCICNQTTLYLWATSNAPNTSGTYESDTDTPFTPDASVSSFSDSRISWFYNGNIPTEMAICWFTDLYLNVESRRWRCIFTYVHWQVKEVSTSSSVDYLTNLSTDMWRRLSTDTNWLLLHYWVTRVTTWGGKVTELPTRLHAD